MKKIGVLLFFLLGVMSCVADYDVLPSYYDNQVNQKGQRINDFEGKALFVYFTDTHVDANRGHSPAIIKDMLKTCNLQYVFWGGDAISAYGNGISIEWKKQEKMFDVISPYCQLCLVRGNHDFTYKDKQTDEGYTYSQREVTDKLSAYMSSDVVSNKSVPDACYYYIDDYINKMRYIVFDTNDSGTYGDVAWGYKYTIGDEQISWIAREAILTTPPQYSIVLFSHVPLNTQFNTSYKNVDKLTKAVLNKKEVTINGSVYDFSKMNEGTRLICIMSGHIHHDMQLYSNGLLQITTASDAFYSDYKRSPFSSFVSARERNSETDQVVEVCKYDEKQNVFAMFRIGYGGDRYFHIIPVKMKVGEEKKLEIRYIAPVSYGCYSSKSEYKSKQWTLYDDVLNVNSEGLVIAKNVGESIVYARSAEGIMEFYDVIVEK